MRSINATAAPEAIGPYCHAIATDGLLFCSGQIPLDPGSMKIVEGGVGAQASQVFANIRAVLDEAGTDLSKVIKTTVFLTDMADFPEVNGLYAEAFGEHRPARSTVAVAALPLGALVEIECVAKL